MRKGSVTRDLDGVISDVQKSAGALIHDSRGDHPSPQQGRHREERRIRWQRRRSLEQVEPCLRKIAGGGIQKQMTCRVSSSPSDAAVSRAEEVPAEPEEALAE